MGQFVIVLGTKKEKHEFHFSDRIQHYLHFLWQETIPTFGPPTRMPFVTSFWRVNFPSALLSHYAEPNLKKSSVSVQDWAKCTRARWSPRRAPTTKRSSVLYFSLQHSIHHSIRPFFFQFMLIFFLLTCRLFAGDRGSDFTERQVSDFWAGKRGKQGRECRRRGGGEGPEKGPRSHQGRGGANLTFFPNIFFSYLMTTILKFWKKKIN